MDEAELDRLTREGIARLDKKPVDAVVVRSDAEEQPEAKFRMTCGRCGHEDGVPDDPEESIYECSECGTRTAYGATLPKIIIAPHAEDRRFLVLRFDAGKRGDYAFSVDRDFAAKLAAEILSVVAPPLHAVLMRAVQAVANASKKPVEPEPSAPPATPQ